jgi:drug/metabolite transporter (DMT)-like permease
LIAAIQRIPVSLVILLFFLHPIMLAVWSHLNRQERLSPARLSFAFMVFAGLCLVIGPDMSQLDPIGLLWGVVSAVAVSAMIIYSDRGRVDTPSSVITIYMTGFTAVLFTGLVFVLQDWAVPQTTAGWIGIVGAGLGLGFGILAFFEAFKHIGPVRASMISNVEPVLGVIVASWVLGERFDAMQWVGIVAVLLGLILFETRHLAQAKMV